MNHLHQGYEENLLSGEHGLALFVHIIPQSNSELNQWKVHGLQDLLGSLSLEDRYLL